MLQILFFFFKVAIKSIRKEKIKDEQDLVHIRREIEIMSSLCHPHIITIYEGTGKEGMDSGGGGSGQPHSATRSVKRDTWGEKASLNQPLFEFRVWSRKSL